MTLYDGSNPVEGKPAWERHGARYRIPQLILTCYHLTVKETEQSIWPRIDAGTEMRCDLGVVWPSYLVFSCFGLGYVSHVTITTINLDKRVSSPSPSKL